MRAAGAPASARAARGAVWGKPPPAAGTAGVRGHGPQSGGRGGRSAAGGARGRAGRDRDLGTCQQGAGRARAGACGRGWVAGAARLALGGAGAGVGKAGGLGRVPKSIGESQAGGGGSAHAGRPSGKLDQLRCGPLGRAADRLPEAAGSVQLRARGESRRRFVANGVSASGPGGVLILLFSYVKKVTFKISLSS